MGVTQIQIQRPVHEVFARVTDLERAREWAPQMGAMHLEGPLREGAVISEERRILGRRATAKWTVTRYEPDRALGLLRNFGPMRGRVAYVFEQSGSGTELTQFTELGLDGPLAILSPLVAREGRKEEDAELGRLKTLLER